MPGFKMMTLISISFRRFHSTPKRQYYYYYKVYFHECFFQRKNTHSIEKLRRKHLPSMIFINQEQKSLKAIRYPPLVITSGRHPPLFLIPNLPISSHCITNKQITTNPKIIFSFHAFFTRADHLSFLTCFFKTKNVRACERNLSGQILY